LHLPVKTNEQEGWSLAVCKLTVQFNYLYWMYCLTGRDCEVSICGLIVVG